MGFLGLAKILDRAAEILGAVELELGSAIGPEGLALGGVEVELGSTIGSEGLAPGAVEEVEIGSALDPEELALGAVELEPGGAFGLEKLASGAVEVEIGCTSCPAELVSGGLAERVLDDICLSCISFSSMSSHAGSCSFCHSASIPCQGSKLLGAVGIISDPRKSILKALNSQFVLLSNIVKFILKPKPGRIGLEP